MATSNGAIHRPEGAVAQPAPLPPSQLGRKEYWDTLYTTELTNHAADPRDEGTVWFDDSNAQAKMVAFLEAQQQLRPSSSSSSSLTLPLGLSKDTTAFLDLGCGNGALLRALRDAGWRGAMLGVDYSAASVELARRIVSTAAAADDDDDEIDDDGEGDGDNSGEEGGGRTRRKLGRNARPSSGSAQLRSEAWARARRGVREAGDVVAVARGLVEGEADQDGEEEVKEENEQAGSPVRRPSDAQDDPESSARTAPSHTDQFREEEAEEEDDDDDDAAQAVPSSPVQPRAAATIDFRVWDILTGPLDAVAPPPPRSSSSEEDDDAVAASASEAWDVVLDKGTFDAISLSSETDEEARRVARLYRARVLACLRDGGAFLITSCNWTEAELRGWMEGSVGQGPGSEGGAGLGVSGMGGKEGGEAFLKQVGKVAYRSFSFGGVSGQTISTLCFLKTRRSSGEGG